MSLPSALRSHVLRAATALPRPVIARLAGAPEEIDGQLLDPQLQAGLRVERRIGPRLETMSPAEARRTAAATFAPFHARFVEMARVFDERAPGPAGPIRVRVFVPRRHDGGMLVWFHGGGGVIGSIDTSEPFCRDLAARARCSVATVDYRLAPEHRHPAAIDDALAVWPWLVGRAVRFGADPARVAVGGDSFGGYLAAWVERRGLAARLPRPCAQLLVYPLVDQTLSSPSCARFGEGYGLSLPLMRWFREHYLPDPARYRDASPIFLEDLRGAPPTLVSAAGFDPLRDEGRAYADRLEAAGARVAYHRNPGLIHGFIDLVRGCDAAAAAVEALGGWLHVALGGAR